MTDRPLMPSDGLKKDPYGAHEPPIYQTSTFTFERASDVAAAFAAKVEAARTRGPLPPKPDMAPGTLPNPPRPGNEPRPPKKEPTRRPRY